MVFIETAEGNEMNFDHNFKPNRDNLPPVLVDAMNRVFYSRRSQGMNVQWMNNGKLDEWSMESAERAEKFAANLARKGIPAVISN